MDRKYQNNNKQLRSNMNFKSTIIAATTVVSSICAPSLKADEISGSNLIANGDMTKGNAIPVSWDNVRSWGGKIEAHRDTNVYKKGPASLRVQPIVGKGKGVVSQLIEGFNGKIKVTGSARFEDGKYSNAQVAVQLLDKEYKPIKWNQVHAIRSSEWVSFDKEIEITQSPALIQVLMMIDGHAKVWLDELKVTKSQ